jgi:hypothetical protein
MIYQAAGSEASLTSFGTAPLLLNLSSPVGFLKKGEKGIFLRKKG